MAGAVAGRDADSGVANGSQLLRFVDRVLGDDRKALSDARDVLREAIGDAAFVDAAATVASFNAVVKIADGTGISLEPVKAERTRELRQAFGVDALRNG